MKCPNCGFDRILPMYKICPQCKQPLNKSNIDSNPNSEIPERVELRSMEVKSDSNENTKSVTNGNQKAAQNFAPQINTPVWNAKNDVGRVTVGDQKTPRNFVSWIIASGQIARIIPVAEFSGLGDAEGVYVQEGVTAVLFIDGTQVAELNGGLYKFATDPIISKANADSEKEKTDLQKKEGLIQKIGRLGRSVWNFIYCSERKIQEEKLKDVSTNSLVSVVLKRDGAIPFMMGIRPAQNANGGVNMEFAPYKIHTATLSLDVAVSLEAKITDFREFRINYLVDKTSYSVNDMRIAINTWLRTSIQRVLQTYKADGQLLPPDVMSSVSYEIISSSQNLLHGITISSVLDIQTDNEAFERFRALEEKFFCTEKEIDFVNRSNEFKNRLQQVENAQKIEEAHTEFDLRKELDKINNDKLIHEDEMEAFVQLLQSQKRIRIAKTETEELAALLELKKNRLVSEDEYDALENRIRDKKFDRDQVSAAFQLTAANRTETVALQLNTQLTKSKILAEAELQDARFEAYQKATEQKFSMENLSEEHRREQEKKEFEHQSGLLDVELSAKERQDDYSDKRREKDYNFTHRVDNDRYEREKKRAQDIIDFEKQRAQNEMEALRQKAEIARQNMQSMQEHEREMAEKTHQEEMARINAQQTMSADQIMASGASNLSAEAQKAFAESLASGKFGEKERELFERMIKMQAEGTAQSQAQQADMMQQMMNMMQGAMQTNASMATNMAAGQAAQNKAQLEAMQKIAGVRVSQSEQMKEEYRKQMEHEQKRTDATQDKALNYTTKITQEEIKAFAKTTKNDSSKKNEKEYYLPDFGENYTRKEVENYILQGLVNPETDITKNGEDFHLYELDEFIVFLLQKFGETCPNCGKTYLKGFMCECGYEE